MDENATVRPHESDCALNLMLGMRCTCGAEPGLLVRLACALFGHVPALDTIEHNLAHPWQHGDLDGPVPVGWEWKVGVLGGGIYVREPCCVRCRRSLLARAAAGGSRP
jgi:hypothetical protein